MVSTRKKLKALEVGSRIGILGGGQLGRMLALAARQMGYRVHVLEPTPDAPCSQVADKHIVANYDDIASVLKLGKRCDVVTYEFENIDVRSVIALEEAGYPVFPSSQVLKTTQHRILEKQFVQSIGINTAPFYPINTAVDLEQAASKIGFPAIIKTAYGGYDGKGQVKVANLEQAQLAFQELPNRPLIWEKMIKFTKELGIICVRDRNNQIVTYPVTENIHVENILDTTLAPAFVSPKVVAQATEIARQIAHHLNIVGVFCVEMFLLENNDILVNEIAPRPHNSGHYSIDACLCSQFEQQLRAICNLPLGSPRMLSKTAVMVNILGDHKGDHLSGTIGLLSDTNVCLHLYGKKKAKTKRKMGHFTVLADDLDEAVEIAQKTRKQLRWIARR
jgi:5-(carboxyamino)imidazole ribonucleotide synthase